LSAGARAVLDALPKDGPLLFAPIPNVSRAKAALDKASGVTGWTIHDCRRTARSLMSRAGVSADHAERCLGHVIPGVRGIYDKYEYRQEKAHAFEALAALIERIVEPPGAKVVAIRR
jgi:integrase